MKILKFFDIILIFSILFYAPLGLFSSPALAQTQTTFTLNLASNATLANSNLTLNLSVPEGFTLPNNVDINMPAGWDIRGGTDVAQGAQVGSGTFRIKYLGTTYDLALTAFNEQDIGDIAGTKARWKIIIGDAPFTLPAGVLYWSWVGSATTGYVFNVNSPIIAYLSTPAILNFTFFGVASSGQPVLVNPATGGNYVWSIDLNYTDGSVTTLPISFPVSSTAIGSVDGTLTSPGVNVTNTVGSTTVQYSAVSTLGSTTVTATTTAPAAGTGQFQLSEGLYYDFNTTATISCPCTITLPYDPATTPDPRIYHLENGVWVDVTISFDPVAQTVTGIVSTFSYFVAAQPAYTAQWLSPVRAFNEQKDKPFNLNKNQALPLNLIIKDSSGNVFLPPGLVVELIRVKDGQSWSATIPPQIVEEGTHLYGLFQLKTIEIANFEQGEEFLLRVRVGNTTLVPDVHFTIS